MVGLQAYGAEFASVYNQRWSAFSLRVAPRIRAYYESRSAQPDRRTLLDLCCGTGQLAAHFLEHGYRVVGVDASPSMLRLAEQNTRSYVQDGRATFLEADASQFTLNQRFDLIVSTFDALNHLPDEEALRACLTRVYDVSDGMFIFDLNTRAGLMRWQGIHVDDGDDLVLITRGILDEESERAWMKITGFVRTAQGEYRRFQQTAFNTVFEIERVRQMLLEIGWRHVHIASENALDEALEEPELQGRVFFVASK